MSYYVSRTVDLAFEEAVQRAVDALQREGFGVLTEIDVKETLKKKLGVTFRDYKILGACNPPIAYRALQAESMIGTLLPCNVIVQDVGEGRSGVAAIDPVASMQAVQNPKLAQIAEEVRAKLKRVVDQLA
jgi:uncharacterized protein (DUF302 family)